MMSEQGVIAHIAYDWMIATYFFFAGVSAGAYLLSVTVTYVKKEFCQLGLRAGVLSLLSLGCGMLFLFVHLGQPFRAWRVFLSFNPHSPLSYGVWFLNIFLVIDAVYVLQYLRGKAEQVKAIAYAGTVFSVLSATYTGVLLAQAPGRVLWHTALMPVLFLNGAFISGAAVVMLFSARQKDRELVGKVGQVAAWLIILELAMIAGELVILGNGGTEGVAAAKFLLTGKMGAVFLGVEIVLGAVVPVLVFFRRDSGIFLHSAASFLTLAGILTMRFVIVIGGQLVS